jgi:hypothetical protein
MLSESALPKLTWRVRATGVCSAFGVEFSEGFCIKQAFEERQASEVRRGCLAI